MLSFLYRAWADAQPVVEYDRPSSDRFARFVGSLFGMTDPEGMIDGTLSPETRLHFAGHLACPTRCPEGLRAMLADYFAVPVDVREFVGAWMDLPESWWCRLGDSAESSTLGRTITLGARVWECQNKFRVVLGPFGLEDYRSFLPGEARLSRLASIVRGFTNDQWSFDVQLVLERSEVRATVLGGDGRLGWTTWIVARPSERDPDDLIVELDTRDVPDAAFREVSS
jgi:type VI secretion system protein ImpH